MKRIITTGLLLLSFISYGLYIAQFDLHVLSKKIKPSDSGPFFDYRGVLNVQTDLSRGSASPLEVISAAKTIGLDFLFLTDINLFDRPKELNGYHGSTLVDIAGEFGFLDSRLLYLSEDRDRYPKNHEDSQLFFTDRLTQLSAEHKDNLVILARPFNPSPTWLGSFPTGIDGIEILNPKSISHSTWVQSKLTVLWTLATYPFNTRVSLLRLFREMADEINLWDRTLQERPLWGFAGADASARAIPFTDYLFRFPSYFHSLGIAQVHLQLTSELTGNYSKDRHKLFQALKGGHFYSSLDLLEDPTGFTCYLQDRDSRLPMGTSLAFRRGQSIIARLPATPTPFFEIVLLKNGSRVATSNDAEIEFEIKEPGIYRVEVRASPVFPFPEGKKWINWIYGNPFFIK